MTGTVPLFNTLSGLLITVDATGLGRPGPEAAARKVKTRTVSHTHWDIGRHHTEYASDSYGENQGSSEKILHSVIQTGKYANTESTKRGFNMSRSYLGKWMSAESVSQLMA